MNSGVHLDCRSVSIIYVFIKDSVDLTSLLAILINKLLHLVSIEREEQLISASLQKASQSFALWAEALFC